MHRWTLYSFFTVLRKDKKGEDSPVWHPLDADVEFTELGVGVEKSLFLLFLPKSLYLQVFMVITFRAKFIHQANIFKVRINISLLFM